MRLPAAPVILAALSAACGEPAPRRAAAATLPPDVAPGLGVYVARCEGCHGIDGGGTRAGPSLLTIAADSGGAVRLVRSLRDGVPPTAGSTWTVRGMPPVPMTPEDEARLLAYLRWLRAGDPADTP
ncbi:MAG TPA: cytochrome c [Gemmatimonadales bacterium]|nr:cytochrome c [Gemmatimonadales bacterium]